ncbi:MAG: tetratricopeptide repeat protein [Acidobacteria bacterium]|nr:tetratricopeptide repeat protein [Acidobacteriota bacterium]
MSRFVEHRMLLIGVYLGLTVTMIAGGSEPDLSIREWVEQGNWLYQEKRYDEAMSAYCQAERQGAHNADLYYNIGNAAFRLKRTGRAILYYERALWLDPGHDDARHNLSYVQQFLTDRIPETEASAPARAWGWLISQLGLTATGWIGLVLWAVLCLLFVLFFRWRHEARRRPAGVTLTVVLLLFIVWAAIFAGMIWRLETIREGIILTEKVDVRSGPAADDPILFTVHEGHKVSIRSVAGDWYQIVLPNGWNGWSPAAAVGEIQLPAGHPAAAIHQAGESANVDG